LGAFWEKSILPEETFVPSKLTRGYPQNSFFGATLQKAGTGWGGLGWPDGPMEIPMGMVFCKILRLL